MLTKQESLSLLQPHYLRILKIVANACDRLKCLDTERHALRKTSLANVYRDLLVDEARKEFSGMESLGVALIDHSDSSFFIEFSGHPKGINGALWARLKKVRRNLLTSNIPTRKAVAFCEQEHIGYSFQPYLEGEDWQANPKPLQPSHINFGHLWNDTGSDVQAVYVTSPNGRSSISWFEHIDRSGDMTGGVPAPNDNVSAFPYELEISQRKPKRVSAKQKDAGEEKRKKKNERKS